MKKSAVTIILIALLCCVLLPTLSACDTASTASGTDKLYVYNWEDYIAPGMVKEFEAYYFEVTGRRLEITYTTFDTNETMMTKVLKGDANVDLICPSEYSIEKLLLAGCLENHQDIYKDIKPELDRLNAEGQNITLSGMSSLGNGDGNIIPDIMEVIRPMFGALDDGKGNVYDMTEYMVPYLWGTLGILYNTSVVSMEELEEYGWGVLWNIQHNEELENKILMKDSVRDSYAAAVFYMYENTVYNRGVHKLPDGISPTYNKPYAELTVQELINCTDDAVLNAAEVALTEQRDHISGYEVDFGKDDMINEIVYADFAWSGDAMWAIEDGGYDEETDTYQLGYYVPPIASNIWYDGWVIPKTVRNKLAAMLFIDYMCRPMSGIQNSMEVGYSSAVSKELMRADEDVCAFIEENDYDIDEYFDDEARYPEINENLGVMRDFGSANESLVQMWQRAKSGNGISVSLWWILLVIVLLIGIVVGGYFLLQALKLRPRKLKADKSDLSSDSGQDIG
ncbi:MAG: extracellular solute-binding protein [Clostridia bacterium]|nr:extracellular solute-binding protein [Clostridia bacterium]